MISRQTFLLITWWVYRNALAYERWVLMIRSSARTATYIYTDPHQLFVISANIRVITLMGSIYIPRPPPVAHFSLVTCGTFRRRSTSPRRNTINAWIGSSDIMRAGVRAFSHD